MSLWRRPIPRPPRLAQVGEPRKRREGERLLFNDTEERTVRQLDGVRRTQTMVAFEAYSRHDLEAMFSVGQ